MVERFREWVTHEKVIGWASSPATLVTIFAPVISDVCFWLFVATSAGMYATLAKTPDVCALVEHRTQVLTVAVAYVFCALELIFGSAALRFGLSPEQRTSPFRANWGTTFLVILTIAFVVLALGGWFMNEQTVALYRAGPCETGVPNFFYPPPLLSPLTWVRVLILFTAVSIGIMEK